MEGKSLQLNWQIVKLTLLGADELTYRAKTERVVPLIFLFGMMVYTFINFQGYPSVYVRQIPFLALILIALLINFKFTIEKGLLTFTILLYKFPVYKKEVSHSEVEHIQFKRVGWSKKCAIIKNNKSFNLRIVNFYPTKIYDDLIDFAEKNRIPMHKTEEYQILERMK